MKAPTGGADEAPVRSRVETRRPVATQRPTSPRSRIPARAPATGRSRSPTHRATSISGIRLCSKRSARGSTPECLIPDDEERETLLALDWQAAVTEEQERPLRPIPGRADSKAELIRTFIDPRQPREASWESLSARQSEGHERTRPHSGGGGPCAARLSTASSDDGSSSTATPCSLASADSCAKTLLIADTIDPTRRDVRAPACSRRWVSVE